MIWSVLGAGVTGLCVATALAERGEAVEVVVPEAAPPPISYLAGGMLAPFCEGENAPDEIVEAGQLAINWWARRVGSFAQRGTLVVASARDQAELARFARASRNHSDVIPDKLEPDLAGRFARGLFFASEAHLDPFEALASLRHALTETGVRFVTASKGRVIDCRGWAAQEDLADLRPVRGEMLIVHAPDVVLTRPVRLLHPRFACYIVPRGAARYMIGATMLETAQARGVTARALVELLSAAYSLNPGFAEAEVISTGTGLRPAFVDNIPRIRHTPDRIHVNGMYRHGFLMAPVLAERLAIALTQEIAHAH